MGQGRENAREYLKQNPSVTADIDQKVREALKLGMVKARGAQDE
jgi:hypothetical protein